VMGAIYQATDPEIESKKSCNTLSGWCTMLCAFGADCLGPKTAGGNTYAYMPELRQEDDDI